MFLFRHRINTRKAGAMTSILGIGECMIELSSAGDDLWRQRFSGDVFNALWYARAHSADDADRNQISTERPDQTEISFAP